MYKVAIVDDELTARKTLKKYFDIYAADFEVVQMFAGGSDLVEYLKENSVDAVFTDVKMPGMTGIEVARWIHENRPGIRVVIVSGYSEFQFAQEAMRYRVMYYLLKVIDIKEFVRVIEILRKELSGDTVPEVMDLQRFFYNIMVGGFGSAEKANEMYKRITGRDSEKTDCLVIKMKLLRRDTGQYDDDDSETVLENFLRLMYNTEELVTISDSGGELEFIVQLSEGEAPELTSSEIEAEIIQTLELNVRVGKVIRARVSELYTVLSGSRLDNDDKNKLINSEAMEEASAKAEFIARVKAYINEHYSEGISRKTIADNFSMNVDYIGRQFKEVTNKNIIEYIQEKRITRAIELMRLGKNPEEACELVGYVDFRSFKRLFKKFTGMGIGEFRKTIINEEKR